MSHEPVLPLCGRMPTRLLLLSPSLVFPFISSLQLPRTIAGLALAFTGTSKETRSRETHAKSSGTCRLDAGHFFLILFYLSSSLLLLLRLSVSLATPRPLFHEVLAYSSS